MVSTARTSVFRLKRRNACHARAPGADDGQTPPAATANTISEIRTEGASRHPSSVRTVASRHDGLAQIAVVLAAVGAYELPRLALRPDWPLALDARPRDRGVGTDRAPRLGGARSSTRSSARPALVQALNAFYLAAHFPVTGRSSSGSTAAPAAASGSSGTASCSRPAIALLVAWRFPTAPPRVAASASRTRCAASPGSTSARPGSGGLSDPVAAVPSLHAGWALGVAPRRRPLRTPLAVRARRRALPARGRRDDPRDRQPLRPRRPRGRAPDGPRPRPSPPPRRAVGGTIATCDAGWSSQVARRAHNPEVAGSNPAPAIRKALLSGAFCLPAGRKTILYLFLYPWWE